MIKEIHTTKETFQMNDHPEIYKKKRRIIIIIVAALLIIYEIALSQSQRVTSVEGIDAFVVSKSQDTLLSYYKRARFEKTAGNWVTLDADANRNSGIQIFFRSGYSSYIATIFYTGTDESSYTAHYVSVSSYDSVNECAKEGTENILLDDGTHNN